MLTLCPPRGILTVLSLLTLLAAHGAAQQPCALDRVSVGTGGVQAPLDTYVFSMSMSSDGRFVVWSSDAPNLVPNDTNLFSDVFVRDRYMGITERVSLTSTGQQTNGTAGRFGVDISDDGRWVVFTLDEGFVLGQTMGPRHVYLRDRLLGQTIRVSEPLFPVSADQVGVSSNPAISADGRFVAFCSHAFNLVANDTNGRGDVFVRDLAAGTTQRVSVTSNGAQGTSMFETVVAKPALSGDGRFVAFTTSLAGLVPADPQTPNNDADVFRHDRLTGMTVLVSAPAFSSDVDGNRLSLSADGQRIAFEALGDMGFGNGADIYVYDFSTGTVDLVSRSISGGLSTFPGAAFPSISADGTHVSFQSYAANLVAGDTDTASDVFVRDLQAGVTERISDGGASGPNGAFISELSHDAQLVCFLSRESQSVITDTNGADDLFLRACSSPFQTVCVGSAASCPCGVGASSAGCPNSFASSGAMLATIGHAALSFDTVKLVASNMPNGSCLFLQAASSTPGPVGFGDGLLCLSSAIVRLGITTSSNNTSEFPSSSALSVIGGLGGPGLREYQALYRDAAAFCTSASFNLTNGVQLTWVP